MPDDLYDRDVLAWSERQAELLRRLARGEQANDLDWDHVVEEIEDVGLSELHAVESHLEHLIVQLLKLCAWPDSDAVRHWQAEIVGFQRNAKRRFAPSMRRRIALDELYSGALEQVVTLNGGDRPEGCPETCPFTLDELLSESWLSLEQRLRTPS